LETQRTVEASARYAIATLTIADGHECQQRVTFPLLPSTPAEPSVSSNRDLKKPVIAKARLSLELPRITLCGRVCT
jgi:hypothetical protein